MKRLPLKAAIAIVIVAMLALIAFTAMMVIRDGFTMDTIGKSGVILMGLVVTLIRLLIQGGAERGLKFYARAYEKELQGAFLHDDQKKERKALLRAVRYYDEKRYQKAIDLLMNLLRSAERREDFRAVCLFHALACSDSGLIDEAISSYEKALHYCPEYSTAWSNLGILYGKKGRKKDALEAFFHALEADPSAALPYNNIAQLYLRHNQWGEAITYAEKAIALQSNLAPAANALAIAHYALGNYEESRKYADIAVMNGSNRQSLATIFAYLKRGESPFEPMIRLPKEVEEAMDIFRRETVQPMVAVCLPAPKDGLRSRVGGATVGEAPIDAGGAPMCMLAAIWCSEVHGVPDFPESGILRFFVADNDMYGMSETLNDGKNFRVLYTEDENAFGDAPWTEAVAADPHREHFPVKGCYPVRFEPKMGTILASDYRFIPAVERALRRVGIDSFDALSEDVRDELLSANTYGGHRIGGYPCFEQADPREDEAYRKYDTLLLQLVSHDDAQGSPLILFGDDGGCQFFISREALRRKDFSDVLYTWDCK